MLDKKKKIIINPDVNDFSDALNELECTLKSWKVKDENRAQALLTLEELLVKMSPCANEGEKLHIILLKNYKRIGIRVVMRGEKVIVPRGMATEHLIEVTDDMGPEAESVIRDLIIRSSSNHLAARYSHGINTVDLRVEENRNAMIYSILTAIVLAIVIGIVLRLVVPHNAILMIAKDLFMPMYNIFIRAIQVIMVPLVFFSLASSMMSISDVSTLGRSGGKVLLVTILAAFTAIGISTGVNLVISPGSIEGLAVPVDAQAVPDAFTSNLSIVDTIVNIVPDNMLGAFVKADMLQIIFLAILTGLSAVSLSKYSQSLRWGVEAFASLFEAMTMKIIKIMPLGVFGAMANLIVTVDISGVLPLLAWIGTTLLYLLIFFCILLLIVVCFFGMSPKTFIGKASQAIVMAFSTASSNASMSAAMQCCKQMGISPRSYNFSIPFGITINKMGTCGVVTSVTLFLASIYNVEVTPNFLFTMAMSITLLIIATPGVPGALTAVMLVLLNQLNIPVSGFMLLVGISPLIENFETIVNVVGNIVTSLFVAKSENMIENSAE